ncbi:MAG: septum site-determining protein MinD [Clostridia bacterium]|nr:septum site-determining protein MinD [Clostridia bacterium]
MARKIVITSGKGGVGKTTICTGLGFSLAKMGYSVLLVDGDIGLNNLDILTGTYDKITYDIFDVISGKCRINQAIVRHNFYKTLFVLPSVKACFSENVKIKDFYDSVICLNNDFDFILIDSPAGVEFGFERAVCVADEVVLATTPHITSIKNTDRVSSFLNGKYFNKMSVVINKIRGDLVLKKEMLSVSEISKALSIPILGIVPEFDEISVSASINGALNLSDKVFKAFDILAQNICFGKNCLYDYKKQHIGLFKKILNSIKRS